MTNAPQTIAELMKGRRWRIILQLFKRNKVTLTLSTSVEQTGQYSKVTLDGEGFKIVTDRAAFQAAFTGSDPKSRVIDVPEEILEAIQAFDETVSETEVVEVIVKKIDELMLAEKPVTV